MASTFMTEELYGTLAAATAQTEKDSAEYAEITEARRNVYRALKNEDMKYTVSGRMKDSLRQAAENVFVYITARKDDRNIDVTGELEDIVHQIDDDDFEEYRKDTEEQDRLAVEDWEAEKEARPCCHRWTCDGTCPNFDPSWCI